MTNVKEREYNYDLLRVLSAFAVAFGHVSALFIETLIWDLADGLPLNHPLFSVIYTSICRFSVPVFLMLSGAFVLASPKTSDAASFYRRSWKRIGIPAAAAALFGFLWMLCTGLMIDHTGAAPALEALRNGAPFYHLWYLPVLFGTYILAPWIRRFMEEVSFRTFEKVSACMLVLGCLALWATPPVVFHWNIGEAFCYIGFFMIGYVLRENGRGKTKGGLLMICAAMALHVISALLLYRALLSGADRTLAEHRYIVTYAPLTVAASLLVFAGFARLKAKPFAERFAPHTYNIYLIHAFLLDIAVRILRAWKGQRWLTHLDARFAIPLGGVILYLLSFGCSVLLKKLRKPEK